MCSSPLPEGLDNPVLDKMLEPAPYLVPSKEDDGGNKEGERGPHLLLIPAGGMSTSAREDNQREESDILSPRGRKRTTSEDPETKVSKREKKSSSEVLPRRVFLSHNVRAGISPLSSCK